MPGTRTLCRLAAVAFLLAVAAGALLERGFRAPGPLDDSILFDVPKGSGLKQIADSLEAAGAIRSAAGFVLASWLRRAPGALKAGEYELSPGESMLSIHDKLTAGLVLQRRVTLPEGGSVADILAKLESLPGLVGDIPEIPPEGSLAPDTYFYVSGERRAALLERMQRTQTARLQELWTFRAKPLPLQSPREALTLASIIEKETALAEERPLVASVFINRLRHRMRLQSDPTVIYGLTEGKAPLGRPLSRHDLRSDNAYNTYRRSGLPPGPICNPGRASIEAALRPAETRFRYFVADGSGGHAFAETLREHNRNVRRWRQLQRQSQDP